GARVGMPNLNTAAANADPDPYLEEMYPNVESGANKGVILEIRRERRVELFNEGFRWDDLMRWKEGKKIEKPMVGMYFSGLGAHDFNNDGQADVFLHQGNTSGAPTTVTSLINVQEGKVSDGATGTLNPFERGGYCDERSAYYCPPAIGDLQLNQKLVQSPCW